MVFAFVATFVLREQECSNESSLVVEHTPAFLYMLQTDKGVFAEINVVTPITGAVISCGIADTISWLDAASRMARVINLLTALSFRVTNQSEQHARHVRRHATRICCISLQREIT